MAGPNGCIFEFGPYTLDAPCRLLTFSGRPVPLAPKTFDLLLLLLQSGGRAVSKQELMTTLWSNTFVEESNIAFQISTLRKALGESGAAWIETIPRHGYRFVAPVEVLEGTHTTRGAGALASPPAEGESQGASRAPSGSRLPWIVAAGLVPLVLMLVSWGWLRGRSPDSEVGTTPLAVPVTAYPGSEGAPSLSPDGSLVAFSWDGPAGDNRDIYVKLVGDGEPVRLTTHAAADDNPAWSPDGRLIAFQRFTAEDRADLFVMPALGGAEKRLATGHLASDRIGWPNRSSGYFSWTPDGRWLVLATGPQGEGPGLWLLAVDGSSQRRLTEEPDRAPAFSPDGRFLAFTRVDRHGTAVYALPLSASFVPVGSAIRLTPRATFMSGIAWMPSGDGLLFASSGHVAVSRLRRVPFAPQRHSEPVADLLPFGEGGTAVSISRNRRLVYSTQLRDTNLWRVDVLGGSAHSIIAPSTYDDHTPAYSPDGTRIAFASTRSGVEEIWVGNADGSNLRRMTSMGGPQCSNPQWSPDGRLILFNSRREGSSDLYLLEPEIGSVRRLTDHPSGEYEARWSRDGRTIYFGSTRTGRLEVWRMPSTGGEAVQVTRDGGLTATESPDGRFLYYAKAHQSPTEIWRVPVSGGEERVVALGLSYPANFVVANRGLYLVSLGQSAAETSLDFIDFATTKRTTIQPIGKVWWYGMALSPDERSVMYSVVDSFSSNLMVVDRVQ